MHNWQARRAACNGLQWQKLGSCARHPHEMEADSYANPCLMYAPVMSRLHQGCVLLSGFAELQKKSHHSEIRCITHHEQELVLQSVLCNGN